MVFGHTFRNGTMLAYRQSNSLSNYILHKYTNGTWYVAQKYGFSYSTSTHRYMDIIEKEQLLRNTNENNLDIAPEHGWSFSVAAAHTRHWIHDSTITVLPEPGENVCNIQGVSEKTIS